MPVNTKKHFLLLAKYFILKSKLFYQLVLTIDMQENIQTHLYKVNNENSFIFVSENITVSLKNLIELVVKDFGVN